MNQHTQWKPETKWETAHVPPQKKTPENLKWKIPESHGLFDLLEIRKKLKAEGEEKLLASNAHCQEPLVLECLKCGGRRLIMQRCKRRWCPCCAKRLAAQRSAELQYIVERMRHPLFVTLTIRNVSEIGIADIKRLRRNFTKLRNQKFWKEHVRGGISQIEITNTGNGWHPHLHAVIDCAWLSNGVSPPPRNMPREAKLARYREAVTSIERKWCRLVKQETASIRVKRADRATIAKEVLKYTVKGEHLVMADEKIGPMLRAMEGTRLMTTFGQAHGKSVRDIRIAAAAAAKSRDEETEVYLQSLDCCVTPFRLPDLIETPRAIEQARALRCSAG